MTDSAASDPDRRALPDLFRDRRASEALGPLIEPSRSLHLELDANSVRQFDAYGAAVARTALDAHLARNARHRATIVEPAASEIWPYVSDAFDQLPAGAAWAGSRSPAAPGVDVLIPATSVWPAARPALEYGVNVIAGALGRGPRPGRLLQEAAQVFLANVEEHASSAPIAPVVCAAFEPVSRNLQLVCVNLTGAADPLPEGSEDMAALVDDSDVPFRSLATLATAPRVDLDWTVCLVAGHGRARHRTGCDWAFAPTKAFVPGFVAAIEVHQ